MALAGATAPIGVAAPTGATAALVGGGEEGRTRGLKLCPPHILAMLECLEKGGNGEVGRISFL